MLAQTHTQIHLVDLHTVEALVRLLDQWTVEQGQLVLEYGLLTMLHLLTVEEARFRLYLTGVYRPFRSIILGDEGASPEAREKAVLCAWFLFEWQVEKLEILDRKVLCCPVVTAPNLRVVCVCACVCVCSCVRVCVCVCELYISHTLCICDIYFASYSLAVASCVSAVTQAPCATSVRLTEGSTDVA